MVGQPMAPTENSCGLPIGHDAMKDPT